MKTTLELPDDLMREIKVRAAREDRKLKDLVTELLRKGLAAQELQPRKGKRVQFPLIHVPHAAAPGEELTPERVHEILLEEEVQRLFER
ncbi:MAG: antitoxin [Dehalococcoidia bacterium]